MKYIKNLKILSGIIPLSIILSGCPTFSLVSPSFTYNNNYNSNNNPNEISCERGGWFSAPYCSIPLSKFISISAEYADPYEPSLLVDYGLKHNSFVFYDIDQTSTLRELNTIFLKRFPNNEDFVKMPQALQTLYTNVKENYIPQKNYKKLMEAYIYIYTLSALHLATSPCPEPDLQALKHKKSKKYKSAKNNQSFYQQQYILYRAFSMQFANDVLNHISGSVTSKYKNERDLYENVYEKILDLNPNRLANLAQGLYDRTTIYLPQYNPSFYTTTGLDFGEIGTFACNKYGSVWDRFGFEFFGTNAAGLRHVVKYKNKDTFNKIDDSELLINESSAN